MNDVFKHSHIVPNGKISCELDNLGPGIFLVCLTCITLSASNGRSCLSRLL